MISQKIETLLALALNATPQELKKTPALSAGIESFQNSSSDAPVTPDSAETLWTLIIRYIGNPDFLQNYSVKTTLLLGNYAILDVPKDLISSLAARKEIIYIEKPKNLFFSVNEGRRVSCVSNIQVPLSQSGANALSLFGKGVLIGIVDSGIDYANPVFRNADGSSRILALWDQSETGTPPDGYPYGAYYDKEQIDLALTYDDNSTRQSIVSSKDYSGHGTAVASIAAGNFSEDRSGNLGMATQSQLIVVKLAAPQKNSFPRTSELFMAIDFVVKKALEFRLPLSLNLSFGNTYGSHTGTSLLETYIDEVITMGQNAIIIGSGNEGISAGHTEGILSINQPDFIELSIAPFESGLTVQIWKYYYDRFSLSITSPDGIFAEIPVAANSVFRFRFRNTELLAYCGEPSPYSIFQEIYLNFLPAGDYLDFGLWTITLTGQEVKNGDFHMWLPAEETLNGSRFLTPSPYATLTIPSTAGRGISVGAYNPFNFAYAPFSGRGYENVPNINTILKPELVAPGVDITTASPQGGLILQSGTSMSAPFVTAAAAMLMEWGITDGNDPYLYGDKLKAYLIKGARKLPGFSSYPNPTIGWGALCVSDSLPQ